MQKKIIFLLVSAFFSQQIFSWSKADDVPVESLPANVKSVVENYVRILRESKSVEEAATAITPIAGGSLVNENGSLSNNTKQFGLKKDFNNIKHYANPIKITRVNKTVSKGDGYGAAKIAGDRYTVWIAKDDPAKGLPAPVTLIVPASGEPKIVNVGSY